MESILSSIETILKDEITIYLEIRELEERKTSAIMDRDGKKLEAISNEQELLVSKIDILERKRMSVTERATGSSASTLSELANGKNHPLINTGVELKNIILKLQELQKTNEQLAKDNLRFYEAILNGLRESSSIRSGYGHDGREKSRVARPALFSQRA